MGRGVTYARMGSREVEAVPMTSSGSMVEPSTVRDLEKGAFNNQRVAVS